MSPSINLTDESNVLPLYHLYYEPNKNIPKQKLSQNKKSVLTYLSKWS